MASRAGDWLRQGQRDLQHARDALGRNTFEWAAFAAQQGAEKAVKGLYQRLGAEARGHSVTQLLAALPATLRPSDDLVEAAKDLDKHYIAPRYPSSYPEGAPMDFYTRAEALRAIEDAERIIEYCQGHILR